MDNCQRESMFENMYVIISVFFFLSLSLPHERRVLSSTLNSLQS